ncbi:MAG: outer membrane protein assembly factor BamB [Gammaproteobacteria bacterium]|nr:outer membrane protein assembly factor BamB [Gammaproteobacteria bacterium]
MSKSPTIKILSFILLAFLGACSKNKDIEQPAKLVNFRESLSVQRLWSTTIGGTKPVMRLGLAPAVSDSIVYVAGYAGDVFALRLNDGKQLWRSTTKASLSGGPGVGNSLVVVGSSKGEVIALELSTGTTRWKAFVAGEVLAAPAVGDSAVVVRTVDGRLVGLDLTDGHELWREEQQIPRLTLRGTAAPVIVGNAAIAGFDNGRVLAVEAQTGAILWESLVSPARGRTELERLVDIDSAVRIAGADVLVAGFQGRVTMLDLNSGQTWWSREISSYRGLAVDDDLVYVSGTDGALIALRRRSGIEVWRQDALKLRSLSAPSVVGTYVAIADFEGIIHWVDASNGVFVARTKSSGRVSNAPVVSEGVLVLQDDEGHVTAFRPRS